MPSQNLSEIGCRTESYGITDLLNGLVGSRQKRDRLVAQCLQADFVGGLSDVLFVYL